MKSEIKTIELPVLGYTFTTKYSLARKMEKDLQNGNTIKLHTFKEIIYEDQCVFIIYDAASIEDPYAIYLGRVEFTFHDPDINPLIYKFYPIKKVNVEEIKFCNICREPRAVIVQNTELES